MAGIVPDPANATYHPDETIARQYKLSDFLRNQPRATSMAGVLAQGLGAVGGNLVDSSANAGLQSNQDLRAKAIQNAFGAKSVDDMAKGLVSSPVPELQTAGLQARMKSLSDDPNKVYRIRAAQALQHGMDRNSPEFRQFVLTGDLIDPLDKDYKLAQIEALRKKATTGDDPSAVREWEYYKRLTPDERLQFLTLKRAEKYLDAGRYFYQPNPAEPGKAVQTIGKDLVGKEMDTEQP